jgi:WXG100 family type VII secretion target
MSNQIRVDTEQVREYEKNLHKMALGIESELMTLRSQVLYLGNTWRDSDFYAFQQKLSEREREAKKFTEEIERISPKLKLLAEKLEEARRNRF